jgi:hypothetical protein
MVDATWLGEDGGPYAIEQYGVTFERGKPANVGDLSEAQLEKLKGNRFFNVSGEKSDGKPVQPDTDEEAEQLRAHLRANGVTPHHNAGLAKLRTEAARFPGPAPAPERATGVSGAPVQPVGAADVSGTFQAGDE